MDRNLDVVAFGHAIVDVLAAAPDQLVQSLGLAKGTMALVDDEHAATMYAALGDAVESSGGALAESSGGSAANTCAGLASLGASAAFVGKVAADGLGGVFADDIRAAGVSFDVAPAAGGPGTGRCLVLVTPDAERTMCTCLGVGDHLGPADVDPALIARARMLYLEGYLCGLPTTEDTIEAALQAAEAAGTPVALSLSDPYWVATHRDALAAVVTRAQLVFANEAEATGMTGAATGEAAARALAAGGVTAVVTRSGEGCVVAAGEELVAVPAEPASQVVDTTGAGDLFAAGFLFGHVRGLGLERSARLGAVCASEVISHFGARPQVKLADLAGEVLGPAAADRHRP